LESRKEYLKKYYQEHKVKINNRSKKHYKLNKKKHLTYRRKRYILKREEILAKKKEKSLAFRGHAYSIWSAIVKYAKKWHLPYCTFQEFYDDWATDDPTYNELYEAWRLSEYNELLSPVVMRQVKKGGFVPENLKWDVKNNYSWWNEDSTIFKEIESELNETQKTYNKSTKEWRKKVYKEWKAKQKARKQK